MVKSKYKYKVLTLHHLPASGGTIFSKAVASIENAVVLSEIHPYELNERKSPIFQFWRGYKPEVDEAFESEASSIFIAKLEFILRQLSSSQMLIIRDHVHADFRLSGRYVSTLKKIVNCYFCSHSIATIRDPIEVWLSMQKRNWTKLSPDDFCASYLEFCNQFDREDIYRYEDFVSDPEKVLLSVCRKIGLKFEATFKNGVRDFDHFTGESGRRGKMIAERKNKWVPASVLSQFIISKNYQQFCGQYGYELRRPSITQRFLMKIIEIGGK
jgi:hypothetical protein